MDGPACALHALKERSACVPHLGRPCPFHDAAVLPAFVRAKQRKAAEYRAFLRRRLARFAWLEERAVNNSNARMRRVRHAFRAANRRRWCRQHGCVTRLWQR
eukprot:1020773-Prymnesium_polylepis.1